MGEELIGVVDGNGLPYIVQSTAREKIERRSI
jgi:hypothetical protein